MATSNERWIHSLQFSSLFSPPPQDAEKRHAQVTGYVELFSQFISEQFPHDLEELIRGRYPSNENTLFDDVLATFVLHHPEHGRAVIFPIVSCIIDGQLEYDRRNPPFSSFISLVCPESKLVIACGEILRILTHYNRPIYRRSSVSSSCLRPLSPWITDTLLQAPLAIRSDFFRWCGGVGGTYAATELIKPPSTGKHPVLVTSMPMWAVVNGAAVVLSVCDEEVARYASATLTEAAVQAVLLPPPKEEHPVAGLPPLEPYTRLFHRYYANSSPSMCQRLLLGLLEAPPSWAPYALEAAVQLVELLRAADSYASGMKLPRTWMCLYFLRAIGIAMSVQGGTAADVAAALLFRILSQPALLFPPPRQGDDGVVVQSDHQESSKLAEATAQEIASMLCALDLEVERRICMIWEAAYGLIPITSSSTDLPEVVVATSLQPPILSWNLYIPLLKVLEHLPCGSPSESCLMKIFVATVEAILCRIFPVESCKEDIQKTRNASKNQAVAELRTIVHSLFLGPCASVELASRLLSVVLTVSTSHEAQLDGSKRCGAEEGDVLEGGKRNLASKQKPIAAAFDSYVIAAICALSCELHTHSLISNRLDNARVKCRSVDRTRRMLAVLEALVSPELSSIGTSNEIVASVMVAAHVHDLLRRSKAFTRALLLMTKRKWDKEVRSRASSLINLIDAHCKTVASIADKARPLEARLLKKRKTLLFEDCEALEGRIQVVRSVLVEKQEVCFLVVSLLWHALIASPEIQLRAESSSAHQGWRKVVDALSNVVSASPAKAAMAVVVQASSELKPWIGEKARRINERVVKVIAELINSHENSESLMMVARSPELLLRATDGIIVDEACTLPQLELLEATARAIEAVAGLGECGVAVAEGMADMLKCRLAATARCVSHPRAHVRALSTSVLRAVVHVASSSAALKDDVHECLKSEVRARLAAGLPVNFIQAAAKELGCCT
ncbi:protein GIGANTEA-like isoform X2 [Salvia miltiorrhiza]|uniref:protein GIGANTEA-like isoform X2 n=1 Tax=Salvia miltiorrhiza TaxID=226208 RepID=UPI0025AB714D|nr:protein GIGANTEA-like isoform X2 [Salvia miltiorrhiza]